MDPSFWERLRQGFMQLRADCAIDPPLKPAGRLTAVWTTPPEPGKWRLDHWDREDGAGVARRFEWHAQSAAAQLGFRGSEDAAVSFWLDRIKEDAPEAYVRKFTSTDDAGVDRVCLVEIFDICGLSAEYCVKCQGSEILSKLAPDETGAGNQRTAEMQRTADPAIPSSAAVGAIDPFQEDASARPLGENPFPPDTAAHDAFEEAVWEAKERVGELRSKFVVAYETRPDFLNALYRYRLGYFSAVAYGRLSMVGNAATGELYETWVDNFAKAFLEDTFSRLEHLKEFGESPFLPQPEETEILRNNLTVTTVKMVTHYKRAAASKVREAIQKQKAAGAPSTRGGDDTADLPRPSHVSETRPLPILSAALQHQIEVAKAEATVKLREELNRCWRDCFPPEYAELSEAANPGRFFPPFIAFGVALYRAHARVLLESRP